MNTKQYFTNQYNIASQFLNVITLGEYTNETFSSRQHRLGTRLEPWIDGFFYEVFREQNHCANSYENDLEQAETYYLAPSKPKDSPNNQNR
jgi:hypothetical protein